MTAPDINFPSNPIDGQTHPDDNGVIWTYYDGAGWTRAPVIGGVNDPNVFAGVTTDSLSVGLNPVLMSGVGNSIFGADTGLSIQAGFENVIVGAAAAKALTQGSENTIIGFQAGTSLSNVSADSNVIIGHKAQGSLIDARSSVVIGHSARTQASGDNNSIVIGQHAIGAGSNSVVIGDDTINTTALKGTVTAKNITVAEILSTPTYTLATLPVATTPGQIIFVSDSVAIAGGVHCSSNGTNWVIMGTATPVT